MAETIPPRGRVILVVSPSTYRAGAFVEAAERLQIEAVPAVDLPEELARAWSAPLSVDLANPDQAVETLVDYARQHPVQAVLAVDDSATIVAARAAAALGLAHNSPDAALAARDKLVMREKLAAAHVPVPRFRPFRLEDDPDWIASQVEYPCVVKPPRWSGSRGVIRANDPAEFVAAFRRLHRLMLAQAGPAESTCILVEDFIPGREVALEGLLTHGELRVLALFDKPDPLDGPFFEETIYVTPSRLDAAVQQAIAACTAAAAAALGLRGGPVHAELRVNETGPWIVEIAGRSIGGLCSSVLRFGAGVCLEELILSHAAGLDLGELTPEARAAGVMMIPIPAAGILMSVEGIDEAKAVAGVDDVEITARPRQILVPLPEGSSYLGFIFAHGDDPAAAEGSLRAAHGKLRFNVRPVFPLMPVTTALAADRPDSPAAAEGHHLSPSGSVDV